MSSSAPGGPPTPAPTPTPTPAPAESHRLRDGIIVAAAGAVVAALAGLAVTLITNSTLVSGNGSTLVGSSDNLPTSTSTVTTEVEGPVVTQTVTRPPTTVTVTQEPTAASTRRSGDVSLPFSGGMDVYAVDFDTLDADWRYGDSQYRDGLDLIGYTNINVLGVPSGALLLPDAADPADPALQSRCQSSTGYTDEVRSPRVGQVYCMRSDEGRMTVARINDAALESDTFVLTLVVWP